MALKCTPGNKPCGKRCIPERYNCGAADADAKLDNAKTYGKRSKIVKKASDLSNLGRRGPYVKKSSARERLKAMEQEAIQLAGSKEKYKQELEQMIKDTGGGITGRILRSTLKTLSPNIMGTDDLNFYLSVKKRGKYEPQVFSPDRSKFKQSDFFRKGDRVKKGDIIRVRFANVEGKGVASGFGYHYGVYLGRGRVIQYGNMRYDPKLGKSVNTKEIGVYETRIQDLNNIQRMKWEKVPGATSRYSPEELDERIKKVKDKVVRYNMMSNNCEHFAYLLTQGKAYSSQADSSWGITGGIIKLFFDYNQLQRRRKTGLGSKEFQRLDQLRFSESQGPRPKGTSMDHEFKIPRTEIDIEKDIRTAIGFATDLAQDDEKQKIGILAGWFQEYLANLTIDNIEK